ncbi:GNAT family N-acetyltransferase [Halobellus captivus]|uniref:GNAT family N-acetyltransferase n=1 Tax=Halobellus captivus TaxID=2592614 RepID=UPI00119EC1DE|nr:GNAT family N-acetyltransferase [Halobellus captivus]
MANVQQAAAEEYDVRRYRPADRDGFLSLYEAVWGRSKGREWFDWRFAENPYADRVEIIVAERRGEVVGAEPLLAFPLASAEGTVTARQPVDWIVHPDHRRRGLFTRMTEELLSTAADRTSVLFNFPSEVLRPGLQKFEWTELGSVSTRYRIQNLTRFAPDDDGASARVARAAASAGSPVVRACLGAIDRVTPTSDGIEVDRVEGIATSAVRAVYGETRPEEIHVPRQEAFLAWRFANPRWKTTTYVARDGGRPVVTLVAATERVGESVLTRLLDAQPMVTDAARKPAFEAALAALVSDHATADCLEASTTPFPGVLRRHGFLSDAGFPLDRVATPTTHAVRSLSPDAETALGADVLAADNWILSLADRDVA